MIVLCFGVFMLCYLYLFFFFKQKTAYEMRISDWSSDVCSSDLPRRRRRTRALAAKRAEATHIVSMAHDHDRQRAWSASRCPSRLAAPLAFTSTGGEIGRASWRGSVCQYV